MELVFIIGKKLLHSDNTNHIPDQIKVRYFKPLVYKEKALLPLWREQGFFFGLLP